MFWNKQDFVWIKFRHRKEILNLIPIRCVHLNPAKVIYLGIFRINAITIRLISSISLSLKYISVVWQAFSFLPISEKKICIHLEALQVKTATLHCSRLRYFESSVASLVKLRLLIYSLVWSAKNSLQPLAVTRGMLIDRRKLFKT